MRCSNCASRPAPTRARRRRDGNRRPRSRSSPTACSIYADDGEVALKEVHNRGVEPESALVRRSSLEDVFLRLTGRTLVD